MQVSNNKEDRSDFLNGLRVRLNVDEKTLSHLEMRMTGKFTFHPILLYFACCGSCAPVYTCGSVRVPWHPRARGEGVCSITRAEYLNSRLIKPV